TEVSIQRSSYLDHRGVPSFRSLTRSRPVYGIWDDHDFGTNDSDGNLEGKEDSLKVFQQFWANPAFGLADVPGVFFHFQRGEVAFFMLDSRYHRRVEGPSLLGAAQREWLLRGLKQSTARFKLVACGSEWNAHGPEDSWAGFPREQRMLLEAIEAADIEGVVFLSGDRHATAGYQLRNRFLEFSSGPFGSPNEVSERVPDMLFNHSEGKYFSVLELDCEDPLAPAMTLEIFQTGRGLVERRRFTWDEINGRERLAFLPLGKPKAEEWPLVHEDGFDEGAQSWVVDDRSAWRVEEVAGNAVFSRHRKARPGVSRKGPEGCAMFSDIDLESLEFAARVGVTRTDEKSRPVLIFGHRETGDFFKMELETLTDSIAWRFSRVASGRGKTLGQGQLTSSPVPSGWVSIRVEARTETGSIAILLDETPVLSVGETAYRGGRVGVGFASGTGFWDDVMIRGVEAAP
ncbi:MAG: alkaline phosphatase D family protein, partial [Verrucomicrobiota bacterium]